MERPIREAFVYCRVSTENQEIEGVGLDYQEKECVDYCTNKGFAINAQNPVTRERASATTMKHQRSLKSLIHFMKSSESFEPKYLVVWNVSRFSRNMVDAVTTANELKEKNIILVSAKEDFDLSTDSGMLSFGLLSAVAEYEGKVISARVKAAVDLLRSKGASLGRPPFGYLLATGEDGIKRRVPSRREWDVVQFILACRTAGTSIDDLNERMGLLLEERDLPFAAIELTGDASSLVEPLRFGNIAALLNEYGIPGPGGRSWRSDSISRVCRRSSIAFQ